MFRTFLLQFAFCAVAPILAHCVVGGTAALCATLLLDFVDAYSTFIIASVAILALMVVFNHLFQILIPRRMDRLKGWAAGVFTFKWLGKVRRVLAS